MHGTFISALNNPKVLPDIRRQNHLRLQYKPIFNIRKNYPHNYGILEAIKETSSFNSIRKHKVPPNTADPLIVSENNAYEDKYLKIGIVGFGNFGQFLAERFIAVGHKVLAVSRQDYSEKAKQMGVKYFKDSDDFCEEHPDVVILSCSIISLEKVLTSFPFHRLKRSTLIVDVLSVKVFPKRLLLRFLPPELDILCCHPMFGPDSGSGSWQGLKFMYDTVRVHNCKSRQERISIFLKFFEIEGCKMVEMTCEEHDRKSASTQFITHTVGRVLGAMDLHRTDIDTKGFESLMSLVENTSHDTFDLYYGLFMYNQNATEEIDRLERAFELVKTQLFNRLHHVARERLFHMPSNSLETNTILSSYQGPPLAGSMDSEDSTADVPKSNGNQNSLVKK